MPDRAGLGCQRGIKIADFTQQELTFETGDRFYLFSDGYYDQFGGPKTKKMMRKHFTQLIIASSTKPMQEQGAFLARHFNEWTSSEEQIDDVTVIGIEL